MKSITLNVDDEFASVGDVLKALIVDVKAKKTATQIAADVLPALMMAIGGYSAFSADLKKVDNQIYLLKAIAEAVEPQA